MRKRVATGLPAVNAPMEWAVTAGGILYTAHIPIRPDGSVETGGIEVQTELTLRNLAQALEAAGGSRKDVTQVQVFLIETLDFPAFNDVYRRFFRAPYPNRATLVVSQLLIPGMRIEIVATAHIGR